MSIRIQSLKQEKGITGLETAIILIAFVIVASVLSYVVISAGLFSSQKAKAAVSSGLSQVGSTIELKGNVIATIATDTDGKTLLNDDGLPYVSEISFTVGVVPGGTAVDLTENPVGGDTTNRLIISYQDDLQQIPSMYFTVDYINNNNNDDMLDPGELAMVTVNLLKTEYTVAPNIMDYDLVAGKTFTLSITPSDGSVLPVERTLPSRSKGLVNLY
jgi:flagellin FlaB